MALPRLLDDLLAELDGLGQDDLFLGGQQGDLADLLEVHPDRVVDADHVGADGLEVLGGRLLDLLGVELGRRVGRRAWRPVDGAVLGDDLDGRRPPGVAGRGRGGSGPRSRSSSSSSSSSSSATATARPRRGRRPASLASSRSALPRRGRDRTASTSCLSSGSAGIGFLQGSCRCRSSVAATVGSGEQPGLLDGDGPADRRASVDLALVSSISRAIACGVSPARSASASAASL